MLTLHGMFLLLFCTVSAQYQNRAPRLDAPQKIDIGVNVTTDDLNEIKNCLGIVQGQNNEIKECLTEHDEEVSDAHEAICSKIEVIDETIGSSFEQTSSQLDLLNISLCEKLENLNSDVLSNSDVLVSVVDETKSILCSKIENIDENLISDTDIIVSDLDELESVVCSKIDNLEFEDPCCDVLITQSMIPFTISTPGKYCVAENLSFVEAGNAITIASDDVTLDLCGHTISGARLIGSRGVRAQDVSKILIKNGLICDFVAGVILNNTDLFCIKNILIESMPNQTNGFVPSGIILNSSCFGLISQILVKGTLNGFAFSCNNVVFSKCMAINTEGIGFSSTGGASNNKFITCMANNCNVGFELTGGNKNVFKCCITNQNTTQGFCFFTTFGNIFRNCFAIENENHGFNIDSLINEVVECTAINNTGTGINEIGTNTHLYNNRSNDNGTDYFGVSPVVASAGVSSSTRYFANISS